MLIFITFNAEGTAYKASKPILQQLGKASWYGNYFKGKRTTSGQVFNPAHFTVAHPTLPLNSWVKIINLENNRSAIARVNDRLPKKSMHKVIVDVSLKVAQKLAFVKQGIARVKLECYGHSYPL